MNEQSLDTYDVFISYSHVQREWVRGQLVPQLEKSGLKVVIDDRDFEIGVPSLVNMERAVDSSRHTLVVLTPAWLASEWTEFESLLVGTTDPAARRRKVIPLLLEACKLPPRLAMLTFADFTQPSEREAQMTRLVKSISTQSKGDAAPTTIGYDPNPIDSENARSTASLTNTTAAGDAATIPSDGSPADFVIVTALDEERDAVLEKLPIPRRLAPSGDDVRVYFWSNLPVAFPDGSTGTYQVVVMPLLGMGRVQAATATADAIRRWHPRYIILVGIAGGIAERGVNLGDILVSDQIVDYELQKLTPTGPELRWEVYRTGPALIGAARNFSGDSWRALMTMARPDTGAPQRHIGPIGSGDKVIAFGQVLAKYREKWPRLIGVEMEAAGVAAAAFQAANAPGFFMVRGVSDLADEEKGSATVEQWRQYACNIAASYTIALLKTGPVTLSSMQSQSREGQPNSAERSEVPRYSTSAVHELLTKAFSASELRRLCRDHFPPVLAELGEGSSLNTIADQLVEYCERQSAFERLFELVEQRVPARWIEYRHRMRR